MNKDIKKIFSGIHTAMAKFDASTKSALSTYKAGKERAKQEASRFKDEATEYETRRKALAATAAAALQEADKTFCDDINLYWLPKLRETMGDHITERPASAFLDALRIYKDFNLPMSRAELNSLLTAAGGNFIGLRALASVAAKSGFKLSFPGVEDYEKDIVRLEKIARYPTAYAPLEYIGELKEVSPQRPIFRTDGTVAYFTTTETIYAIGHAQEFSGVWKDLEDIGNRWATAIVPSIDNLEPIKDTDTGEEISPDEQYTGAAKEAAAQVIVEKPEDSLAHKLGADRAREAAESARILEHYT